MFIVLNCRKLLCIDNLFSMFMSHCFSSGTFIEYHVCLFLSTTFFDFLHFFYCVLFIITKTRQKTLLNITDLIDFIRPFSRDLNILSLCFRFVNNFFYFLCTIFYGNFLCALFYVYFVTAPTSPYQYPTPQDNGLSLISLYVF